jgi:hypothetical protein|uniref:Uncharacterized protein n=1 Tax=Picea glauca TaxID=3330 RepID=A0A101LWA8_PICGL|nr:hypothetical protein ABT39_MTgene1839 [Picea glauca]
MLPHLQTSLLQQKFTTQLEALEFAMRLESISGLDEASIPGMAPRMA